MYIKKNYQVSTQIPDPEEEVSLDQLARYLNGIQVDINNLHRELTYWDLYKINYVIDDVNKASSIVNNLAPGQAAVIGFDKSSIVDGEKRSRGDIVIKLINDQLFWIPSKSSGVYQPTRYEKDVSDNVWKFIYTYTNNAIPDGDIQKLVASSENKPTIYGNVFEITNETEVRFEVFDDDADHYIRPIIRFYTEANEILDMPFTLSLVEENSKFRIQWDANPLLKTIQVK